MENKLDPKDESIIEESVKKVVAIPAESKPKPSIETKPTTLEVDLQSPLYSFNDKDVVIPSSDVLSKYISECLRDERELEKDAQGRVIDTKITKEDIKNKEAREAIIWKIVELKITKEPLILNISDDKNRTLIMKRIETKYDPLMSRQIRALLSGQVNMMHLLFETQEEYMEHELMDEFFEANNNLEQIKQIFKTVLLLTNVAERENIPEVKQFFKATKVKKEGE